MKFIETLCDEHEFNLDTFKQKLIQCGPPMVANHTVMIYNQIVYEIESILQFFQDVENSTVVNRLTDVSRYPGAHKHRFDENGYGRGLSGRRNPTDVLSMVWQSTNSLDDSGNECSTFV